MVWEGEVGGREERNEKPEKDERGRGTRCRRKIEGRYRHDIPTTLKKGGGERKKEGKKKNIQLTLKILHNIQEMVIHVWLVLELDLDGIEVA